MKLITYKLSWIALLFFFLFGIFLISCNSVPEPLQPVPLASRSNANAFIATVEGSCNIETVDLSGWGTPIINDDFNYSPSNPANTNWNVWVGGAFNNELQMYTAKPENLTVSQDGSGNSYLVIKAIREDVKGPKYRQDIDATPTSFSYTSARIESKLMVAPTATSPQVRMVARIKISSGYGMWPAFWSYGDNWPTNGEIDVLEARGNEPYKYQTNYFYGRRANQNLVRDQETFITTGTGLTDCWHIYEVIWTKESLVFYFDGVEVARNTGGFVSNLFGKKEKVTLNLAVGGNFFYNSTTNSNPTVDQIEADYAVNGGNRTMLVDWVKVYTRK